MRLAAGRFDPRSTSTVRWPRSGWSVTTAEKAGPTTRPRILSSKATWRDRLGALCDRPPHRRWPAISARRRLREPVDEQGRTDGAALDGGNLQVFVVGVRAAPLGAKTVDADGVGRDELHVARAAQ